MEPAQPAAWQAPGRRSKLAEKAIFARLAYLLQWGRGRVAGLAGLAGLQREPWLALAQPGYWRPGVGRGGGG